MFRNFAQTSIARKWSDSNSAPWLPTRHLFQTVWTIVDYVPALFWTFVYRHSNIILRTSQSGRDDNRKVRLRESPARGWSLADGLCTTILYRQLYLAPGPTSFTAVPGASFSLPSHSALPEAPAHSCRQWDYAWAWLCKRGTWEPLLQAFICR